MKRVLPVIAALAAAACFLPRASSDPGLPAPPPSIGDFSLPDQNGKTIAWAALRENKAVVVVFLGTQCPICNRYLPELGAISKDFAGKGVVLLGVNSNRNEQNEVAAHCKDRAIPFSVLLDADHALADRLAIETTPTALVADASGKIFYRGRIDDDPMGGRPNRRDLREALDAVLAGKAVANPVTEPRGCGIRRKAPAADGPVTYAKDVAPILNANCVQCHRRGNIGPMPLTDFEHASAFAKEIRAAVSTRRMPPWKPVAGQEFLGERKLSQEQIDTIVKWIDTDTPRGDPKDEPETPTFAEGWQLGTPDLVLEPEEDYTVSAQGTDEYRHFVLPTNLPGDQWIAATEFRPGNPRVVHHIIAYVDTTNVSEQLDARDPGPGYTGEGTWPGFIPTGEMGGWAPGNTPRALPAGVGRKLRKNAKVVLQVHYNKCGVAMKDRTAIGLYFAKEPIRQQIHWAEIVNSDFEIPAGDANFPVTVKWTSARDITVISVAPHMHLLGKECETTITKPDGTSFPLVTISNWEFKWQDWYMLKTPLKLPKGTVITHNVVYDNSADNPSQRNRPPVPIRWGEKTTDEMVLVYVGYVIDGEDLTKEKKKRK